MSQEVIALTRRSSHENVNVCLHDRLYQEDVLSNGRTLTKISNKEVTEQQILIVIFYSMKYASFSHLEISANFAIKYS